MPDHPENPEPPVFLTRQIVENIISGIADLPGTLDSRIGAALDQIRSIDWTAPDPDDYPATRDRDVTPIEIFGSGAPMLSDAALASLAAGHPVMVRPVGQSLSELRMEPSPADPTHSWRPAAVLSPQRQTLAYSSSTRCAACDHHINLVLKILDLNGWDWARRTHDPLAASDGVTMTFDQRWLGGFQERVAAWGAFTDETITNKGLCLGEEAAELADTMTGNATLLTSKVARILRTIVKEDHGNADRRADVDWVAERYVETGDVLVVLAWIGNHDGFDLGRCAMDRIDFVEARYPGPNAGTD